MRLSRRDLTLGGTALLSTTPTWAKSLADEAAYRAQITARGWAVAEAQTGRVVASHELDTPLKSASITKTMTALLVAELSAAHPEILGEVVIFSEAAVAKVGTKTGLKAGERLTVHDALYGLMLPSGNDAGVAFSQHFNARLTPGDASDDGRGFIAAMNRRAQALGMDNTVYRSAFGDGGTDDDRTTTPRDLLTLARAAMAQPLVRTVVGTRGYATEATDGEGRKRYVAWSNSNRMLAYPEATGIKTGTTKRAGACLLTEIAIDGVKHHLVALGSTGDEQRYVDTLLMVAMVRRLRG